MLSEKKIVVIFTEDGFALDYEPLGKKDKIDLHLQEIFHELYMDDHMKMMYEFGFCDNADNFSESMKYLYDVSSAFVNKITKKPEIEFTRENAEINLDEDVSAVLMEKLPYAIGMEYVDGKWIENMFSGLLGIFSKDIKEYKGTVSEYFKNKNNKIDIAGRVFFHLVENKDEVYPFAFLATYSKKDEDRGKAMHMPLKNALIEFKNEQEKLLKLLSTVSKAVAKSDFIGEIVDNGEIFSPLKFTMDEAYIFLNEIKTYEECGILCRVPDFWKRKPNRIKLSVSIGDKKPSKVGMDALMSFDPHVSMGDEKISEEELRMLLNQAEGLALLKGKWVEVNHEKIRQVLSALEKAKGLAKSDAFTVAEAIRMHLDVNKAIDADTDMDIEVKNGRWLDGLFDKLKKSGGLISVSTGSEFTATLRHYQEKGLSWLYNMYELGFGACLADDMGLGKTVQIIALLEYLRDKKDVPSLVVVPASLMGNWEKELSRFAPDIRYKMIYSKKDAFDDEEVFDVVFSTYGMVSRREDIRDRMWNLLILDEAQAIKNPSTKQTKAVKGIKAKGKIALTGTPIENNLLDLWSLFDFLNAGLLGTASEFKKFIKEQRDYQKLRNIVSPFMLRRLKTDKNVISELPEKVEIKEYTTLSKKQVALYNKTLKELMKKLEESEGVQRRGTVLASISKFKQICNHPDHFLSQDGFDLKDSGKFEMLKEITQTIYEKRERILIFTQYREMTEPLAKFLETVFLREGLVIHGGTPVKKRTQYVDMFQGEEYVPFMVLSLKAGGVGLNLTKANHVVHFDRWWNPAVENQATDRAFRIGQEKNVIVHKFITKGTIEEKIDDMIEEKMSLSNDIIASGGENWITEMDNEKLFEIFSLE
ncbi:MAG: DEAD/DEAH box helicase [Bacillota bacterium]|nr:DEAD/DEAH box helicase [Bacillota bacterium]